MIEALTQDIVRLKLEALAPEGFAFTPGQYVDLWLPGGEEGSVPRSFSMSDTGADGTPELIIRRYPLTTAAATSEE